MLRRTATSRFGYHSHDAGADTALKYSPFGWNYLLPQNMVLPYRVNRTMTMPFTNTKRRTTKYGGVYVDSLNEMNPVMLEALQPVLSKLAVGRTLPSTDPQEAIADFEKYSPQIDQDQDSHTIRCWLAKVLQLCAMNNLTTSAADNGLELWKKVMKCENGNIEKPTEFLSSSNSSSSTNLLLEPSVVTALLYCISASSCSADSETFCKVFDRAASSATGVGWNATPKFSVALWNHMLLRCGQKGDENGVLKIFKELGDLQFDLEILNSRDVVVALNAIKVPSSSSGENNYEAMKEMLFWFSPEKIATISKTYTRYRSIAELAAEEEEEGGEENGDGENSNRKRRQKGVNSKQLLKEENDGMYYHIQWHNRIRQPMQFFPRRLYFDYKPSLAAFKNASDAKRNATDLVAERIQRWKDEGLLPEDYDPQKVKFYDESPAFKIVLRGEKWRKSQKFLDKPEYGSGVLSPSVAK